MANENNQSVKYSGVPDSLRFQPDEKNTPWMGVARNQLNKDIKEYQDDSLRRQVLLAVVNHTADSSVFASIADTYIGRDVAQQNPEIAKFLNSFGPQSPALTRRKQAGEWHMNAWCAAFVNWCLLQVRIDVRGTPTAAKWLENGTPVLAPKYGCIVVTLPLTTTGSSTGHVGFCVEALAEGVRLLGGNQSRAVTDRLKVPYRKVLGYRWPTTVNVLGAAEDLA